VLSVLPVLAQPSDSAADRATIEEVRVALLRLPYYGVFDFIAFKYERGTVVLQGYVQRPHLKKDAIRAVKRVPRVDEVVDEIQELPVSPHDDEIRWSTFYAIYADPSLSRYAPGGSLSALDRRFFSRRFPLMHPLGSYPIHIIVNRGRTSLFGVVDSQVDRLLAATRARSVPGNFGVENALELTASAAGGQ
jgi:hypothetical protein